MTISRVKVITNLIIISSILSGCQLINPSIRNTKPSPTPLPSPDTQTSFATPTPSPTPTLLATESAIPTTKGGLPLTKPAVKGIATTSTTKVTNPNFDTSFDLIRITNFPGQTMEKELMLYNKSDKKVLFSARASDKVGDTIPVRINDSFELTGEILPLASTTVKIKAYSNDKSPNYTSKLNINFISLDNRVLATKTVAITAYTPVGDRFYLDTDTDSSRSDNKTIEVTYKPNESYPLRIQNRNQRDLNFTAKVLTSTNNKFDISVKSGFIKKGEWWDTDLHFINGDIGSINSVDIQFEFKALGDDTYHDTKMLTVKIRK